MNNIEQQNKLLNLCRNTLDRNKKTCSTCAERKKKKMYALYEDRSSKGLCFECGRPAIPTTIGSGVLGTNSRPQCEEHLFKRLAFRATGKVSDAKMLKNMVKEQDYKCAYTGQKLVIGKNASLDHIIPRSAGGANCRTNLCWCLWEVNMMKHRFSYKEFLAFCRSVVVHMGEAST